MPQSLVLPCCVEAPPAFAPKARYAIEVLLCGLGAEPLWVERAHLAGPSIYYGPEPEAAGPTTVAIRLREETPAYFASGEAYPAHRMRRVPIGEATWPMLFGEPDDDDPIASAFFWLSGWQEHTCIERDRHGRFPYEASLQAAWGTACEPAVDAYRVLLGERLARAGFIAVPTRWAGHDWAFCATHDIDYLRKWRPGIMYRELVEYPLLNRLDRPPPERRRRLASSLRQFATPGDPFRLAIDRMVDAERGRQGSATYFFKAGAHGPHDVHYGLHGGYIQHVFARLRRDGFEIGLHPGYHAHDHAGRMRDERSRLAGAAKAPVTSVRQHYLRWQPEITPALHAEAGFALDSTLGFSTFEGFRHGTCHPFPLFDIPANAAHPIWEMPLCLMDAAIFNRRHLTAEEALGVSRRLIDQCRQFRGVCVMLWHNTLWDEIDFPGWGQHFLDTLDAAASAGGCLTTLSMALEAYR
ncbi:MAG: polysaccharide deacetylase family protein [Rhodothermales bacterium]